MKKHFILKKRSEKTFSLLPSESKYVPDQKLKSFLVLFFKKEHSSLLLFVIVALAVNPRINNLV